MEVLIGPVTVACVACGGEVVGLPAQGVECAACKTALLVVDEHACPVRGLRPRVDAPAARHAFGHLYLADGEPESGPPEVTARLYFVPFYQVTGTMAGVAPDGRAVHRWAVAHLAGMEDRDDLGIAEIDAARLEEVGIEELAAVAELAGEGTLLFPDRERELVEAHLAESVRIPADGTEAALVDRRFALIYYPVWRLRFEAHRQCHQAVIDGLTGTVLWARVPAKQRRRAFLGVLASALGGLALGTMIRHPGLGGPAVAAAIGHASTPVLMLGLVLALTAAGLYLLLLNAAWNSLRYRNELLYRVGLKTRVLIDRTVENPLDRATAWLKICWNRLVAPRRYDR